MKYKGIMFGDGRGTLGGAVYSRNRYGPYIRTWCKPVNPSSSRQQTVRGLFQALAEIWNGTLTDAERTAWNLFGNSVAIPDALGGSIHLTGFSHFLRSNIPILQVGGTRVDDGPTTFVLPEADPTFAAAATEDDQKLGVTFDALLGWANEEGGYLAVSMSQPRAASRNYIGSPFRYAGVVEGDAVTPPTSPAELDVPFAVAADQKIEVFARILRADGRVSNPFRHTSSVAAS